VECVEPAAGLAHQKVRRRDVRGGQQIVQIAHDVVE
jgi:hypothetical protein